uniref:Uncharacterized protein n=1 Tax=Bos mutus grunniens TaxID=30521 RepID=A0A8B9WP85_BOSMU
MKALAAVLLALLWCRLQGRGRAQEDEDDDPDAGREGYDDEDEEEEEAGVPAGSRGSGPQCYTCQSLHKGESCEQVQSCVLPGTCKAIVSSWNTGEGPPGGGGTASPTPVRGPIPAVSHPTGPALSPHRVRSPDHLLGMVCRHMSSHQQDGGRISDDHILLPVQPVQHPTLARPPGEGGRRPPGEPCDCGRHRPAQPPGQPSGDGALSGALPPRAQHGLHPGWPALCPLSPVPSPRPWRINWKHL